MNIKFVTWPNYLILEQTNKLSALIKNWIIGFGDFFGLVIMVTYGHYNKLYKYGKPVCVYFGCFIFIPF